MQRKICLVAAVVMALFLPVAVFAEDEVAEPTEAQLTAISQNCASIKLQLKNTQKADSKSRVQLGGYYESISGKLMVNLSLRLVKNNLINAEIAEQQTDFSTKRDWFKNDFTDYSQALDTLIATDCKAKPREFYDQLLVVRKKRASVQNDVKLLQDIANNHYRSVRRLGAEL